MNITYQFREFNSDKQRLKLKSKQEIIIDRRKNAPQANQAVQQEVLQRVILSNME